MANEIASSGIYTQIMNQKLTSSGVHIQVMNQNAHQIWYISEQLMQIHIVIIGYREQDEELIHN